MPLISTISFVPLTKLGFTLIKYLDQGWIELLGGQGFHKKARSYSLNLDYSGLLSLKSYLFIFFVFIVFLFFMLYLNSLKRAWL